MRRVGFLGLVASSLMSVAAAPAVVRLAQSAGQIAEVACQRPARRMAISPMAPRRYRSRGERHRRVLRGNRLTVSRRTRRRHRRQRRAA